MRLIAFQIVGRTLPVRGATSDFNLRTTLCHLSGKVVIGALASVLAAFAQTVNPNTAQGPGPGAIGPGPGCNLLPAPLSVGATVDLSYFGPPPSESNPSLVGPVQLLRSGVVDATKGTITLPLYRGSMKGSGKAVWYILTDVDDPQVATLLGLNYSAKLTFAAVAARTANLDSQGNLVFDKGTVDSRPSAAWYLDRLQRRFRPRPLSQGRLAIRIIVPLYKF